MEKSDKWSSLKPDFKGDIDVTDTTLAIYSHDASLFEIRPQAVMFPKDSEDIKTLVKWVNENKERYPVCYPVFGDKLAQPDRKDGPRGHG